MLTETWQPVTRPRETTDFEALAERHRPQLERVAMSLTGNADDALDLAQETLIRAFRYFHNFEPGSNFRAWVLKILHNTHISSFRGRRSSQPDVAWEEVAEHSEQWIEDGGADAGPLPEDALLDGTTDEEVSGALETLPAPFRAVVELADLRDYTYAEIGHVLNLPIGTVRSRLFRARQKLRGRLSDYAVREGIVRQHELAELRPAA